MFRTRPKCREYKDYLEHDSDDAGSTSMESDGTGGKRQVTRFKDGSSIHRHGGPVGDVYYDQNGEEC